MAAIPKENTCWGGWTMVDQRDDRAKTAKAGNGDGARGGAAAKARRPAEARQARFGQSFSQVIAVLMRDQNPAEPIVVLLEERGLTVPDYPEGAHACAFSEGPRDGYPWA